MNVPEERSDATAELEESRRRTQAILDASPGPMMLLSRSGTVQAMNRALADSLGMSTETVLDVEDIFGLLPSDIAASRRAAFMKVLSSGEALCFEDERDGRSFENQIYPVFDEDGSVKSVAIHVRDFTQERRAERELRHTQELLQYGEVIAGMGSWEWSATTGRVRWSPGMYRMRQTTPEETPDPTGIAFSAIHPDDIGRLRESEAVARETGVFEPIEYRRLWPDGRVEHLRAQAMKAVDDDGDVRFVGFVQDISEQKLAHETVMRQKAELRKILDASPDGMVLVLDGHVEFVNAALEELSGFSREEMVGTPAVDFIAPEDRERGSRRLSELLAGANRAGPAEYMTVHKDGHSIPVEVFSSPTDFFGRPGVVSTIRDIRERKDLETQLGQSRDSLRALTRHLIDLREVERREIARDIHDELGSLLTALRLDLGGLRDGEAPDATIQDMLSLVSEAMALGSRITDRLRPGVLDQLGLIAAIEWAGADAATRGEFTLDLDLIDEDPPLSADSRTALFRILQEALTNVLRHSQATRVCLRLQVDERHAVLEVADDGVGLDRSNPTVGQGFGLLGIGERVATLGGGLEIVGVPGEGTTLRVSVPLSGEGAANESTKGFADP